MKSRTSSWPLWRLAIRNLLRNRRRTLATGLASVFGFTGLVLLSAYIYRSAMGLRAASVYLNQKSHVAVFKAGSQAGFTSKPHRFILEPADQEKIRSALESWNEQIEFIGSFLSGTGLINRGTRSAPTQITGVEPDLYQRMVQHPEIRKWAKDWVVSSENADSGLNLGAMRTNPHLISITRRLGESLGLEPPFRALPGDEREVQLVAKNYFREMGAVDADPGLMHTTGNAFSEDTSLIAPLKLLQELYATEGIEYLGVFLKNPLKARSLASELRASLGDGYEIHSYDDESWNPFYVGTMNFLYVMGQFFTVLILGAVALAIVNTTTLNLLERTREIGTLRAIGFSPTELKALFVRESVSLCAVSLAIGTGFAAALAAFVNGLNIRFHPPGAQGSIQFLLIAHPGLCAIMAALVLGITVAATVFVVRRQSQTKIVNLLNDTGA